MTMKLKATRFRIRRPEGLPEAPQAAAAQPVAPLRGPVPAAAQARVGGGLPAGGEMLFEPSQDDGFGAAPYATAAAATQAAPGGAAAALRRQAGAVATRPRSGDVMDPAARIGPTDIDAIRREGHTGRQLRMARRVAQKHDLPATSDFDAVRLLRQHGIDPFQRANMLELVTGKTIAATGEAAAPAPDALPATTQGATGPARLPQTLRPLQVPSTEVRAEQSYVADIMRIQTDIARRRRRKAVLLAARLLFFVMLPAVLAGYYYYVVATPMFATKSEFVIQQAENPSTPAVGGLLSGTSFATSQDAIAVQGYLQSREAMLRLDRDIGFRAHFSQPEVDPIRRLSPDATLEAAYKVYTRNVKIAYDPTEGLVKMEVVAIDPETSAAFANALIGYAEEQVDHLTQRMREDQMAGARASFEDNEIKMLDAQRRVVTLQENFKVLSSEVEISLITAQIGQLESQMTSDRLSLLQMESNQTPNVARTEPLRRRIAALEGEIALLRSKLTEDGAQGASIARVQSELLVAQADVQTRQMMLAQSLQSLETARVEANRQTRYLSLSVSPTVPDEAAYPRAFENTMVALLIFAGIYLMISMTTAVLREQVSA